MNLATLCKNTADAIREKKGTSALINPQDFPTEIANIPSGDEALSKEDLAAIIHSLNTDETTTDYYVYTTRVEMAPTQSAIEGIDFYAGYVGSGFTSVGVVGLVDSSQGQSPGIADITQGYFVTIRARIKCTFKGAHSEAGNLVDCTLIQAYAGTIASRYPTTVRTNGTYTAPTGESYTQFTVNFQAPAKTPEEILTDAYALSTGETLDYQAVLTGTVSQIVTPYDSNSITVNMIVNGDTQRPIQCYRLTDQTTGQTPSIADIQVGDLITVFGSMMNYDGKIEFKKGCKMNYLQRYEVEEQEWFLVGSCIKDVAGTFTYDFPDMADTAYKDCYVAMTVPSGSSWTSYPSIKLLFNDGNADTEISQFTMDVKSTATTQKQYSYVYSEAKGNARQTFNGFTFSNTNSYGTPRACAQSETVPAKPWFRVVGSNNYVNKLWVQNLPQEVQFDIYVARPVELA